ncbi:hypothetical protein [Lacticaseibacillus saniviri]|nr:hypothetical protein [Lacticaseibacillus saniviri]
MIKRWRLWLLLLSGLVLSFLPAATNQRASTMAPTILSMAIVAQLNHWVN